MIYKWAMLIGMLLGMCACQWKNITGSDRIYEIQGIQTYRGQDVSQLFNYNGAPNSVKTEKLCGFIIQITDLSAEVKLFLLTNRQLHKSLQVAWLKLSFIIMLLKMLFLTAIKKNPRAKIRGTF